MTRRKTYLDFLRIVAILMVLFNHRLAYYCIETTTQVDLSYLVKALISVTSKCAAPFFFMISGALLLGREEPFIKTLKHRILRILIVMLICAIGFIIAFNEPGDFKVKLNWYFYAYIGFLLMMPFLGLIARNAKKEQIYLYLAIAFTIYSSYGVMWHFWGKTKEINKLFLHLFITSWPSDCWLIIFTLSGYFLSHLTEKGFSKKEENRLGLIMGILSLLSLVFGIIGVIAAVRTGDSQRVERMRQYAIYAPACFLFWACKKLFDKYGEKIPEKVHSVITGLGATTFGIFILENQTTLSLKIYGWLDDHTTAFLGPYLPSIVSILVEFAVYALIVFILRLIPPIRKLL
ncbi:MAG: acyltransferase family protein [Lachnospiraceae bacterium]|nr:acyltransferase family protein [Lachnospiraceae bacterium]